MTEDEIIKLGRKIHHAQVEWASGAIESHKYLQVSICLKCECLRFKDDKLICDGGENWYPWNDMREPPNHCPYALEHIVNT